MRRSALFLVAAGVLFATAAVGQQQPALKLTATSVNVSEPGNNVRIDIVRWSSDQERNQLVTALTPPAPAPAAVPPPPAAATPAAGTEGAAARGGRGGGGGGARGGNAAGARGGGARGGARGGNAAAAPADPISTFTTAIGRAPTIGYIWTNEVTGYAIKYAFRLPSSGGNDRIILASNRRIGANTPAWTPVKGTPTPYEFTVLEIRLPSSGVGEAKGSLTTTIAVDNDTKTIGLENYAAAPALLANVKRP